MWFAHGPQPRLETVGVGEGSLLDLGGHNKWQKRCDMHKGVAKGIELDIASLVGSWSAD